jgi:hypothetical protein
MQQPWTFSSCPCTAARLQRTIFSAVPKKKKKTKPWAPPHKRQLDFTGIDQKFSNDTANLKPLKESPAGDDQKQAE